MQAKSVPCGKWGYPAPMSVLLFFACAPEPDLPTEGSFDALTYNVAGLPDELSTPDVPSAERMPQIADLLDEFPIVGLQEDFVAENHELLLATEHTEAQWFDALTSDWGAVVGSGLTMLARDVEVIDYFEEHYTGCNGIVDAASDCLASKGFQVLRVSLGGEMLDIYNTHHEAGGGEADNAVREDQVAAIIASMDGRSAGLAVLLMGDTNLRWSDPEDVAGLEAYRDAGLLDACDLTSCPEPDHIDRFLMRSSDTLDITATDWWRDERFVDDSGVDLSDHPAIGGRFVWSVTTP